MIPPKNKWVALAESIVRSAEMLQDQKKDNAPGQKLPPSIVAYFDPMAAFQLMLISIREHSFEVLELSLVLLGIYHELLKHFPEIEHLLAAPGMTETEKIAKAKLIFNIEQ